MTHEWNYFRAGNVVQIELRTQADLEHLAGLYQKLWMALSMPTRGLSGDTRTLDLLDTDRDGRIRPPELLAAINWVREQLVDLKPLLEGAETLVLGQMKRDALVLAARRALHTAGKVEADRIALRDVDLARARLAQEVFNGDSVIIPESSQDAGLVELMRTLITQFGSIVDRSGKDGLNRQLLEEFYAEAESQIAWDEAGREFAGTPGLEAAYLALVPVEAKIDDFFTRNRWVAFDKRAEAVLAGEWPEPISLAGLTLDEEATLLRDMPLARLGLSPHLPLDERLNPAWRHELARFSRDALQGFLQLDTQELRYEDWLELKRRLAPYRGWKQRQPDNRVRDWDKNLLRGWSQASVVQSLEQLMTLDEAVAKEYDDVNCVHKLLLYTRDLARILRNFVNFSDFYRSQGAMFQVGTLLIDGRATQLCIEVTNPTKHASMASLAGAYLLYCDCTRSEETPRAIVAVMTAGDSDNLMVGRNGVFYDREGLDWDATVTRIVANPISFREAFWMPYKKFARFIEEQIAKRAVAAEAAGSADLTKTAETVALVDTKGKTAELSLAGKKIDVGTVAALGVALGSITTFLGVIFGRFLDLGVLMPFGVLALVLLISGPSMLLAWLKLRNRNLGPILDANGWAINTMARINVPFAASLTRVRMLPLQAGAAALPDPYAETKQPWRFYLLLAILVFLGILWVTGKLDPLLPASFHRAKMMGLQVP